MKGAVKFLENRVWRVYLGGSGIDHMRGKQPETDGHFPEDWIASTSLANNPQYPSAEQGLSTIKINGKTTRFSEYLSADPEYTLGRKHFEKFGANAALLMKILDAAERLPLQAHPTVPDAEKYYHSHFGKTEAWYVVDVRKINGEEPYLIMGFNPNLNEKIFRQEALNGHFEKAFDMVLKLHVKPGDCFIVPGGLVHAIGCGCTLIETMEPSDLVIQPELFCGKQPLSESERWSNAAPEDAMNCFDFRKETEDQIRTRCTPAPEKLDESLSIVIPYSMARYFEVQKLSCKSSYTLINREKCHRAGVVVSGSMTMDGQPLHCGEAFFLPFGLDKITFEGNGDIIFALPPKSY